MNMDFVSLLLKYTYEVCSCLEVLYFTVFHLLFLQITTVIVTVVVAVVVVVVVVVIVVGKNTINNTHNWKAPGSNGMQNYWYKKLTSIHPYL
jgi:hypothetical protein